MTVRILIGDCRERLRELPDASVNCCVTSPPYFGLRDYGVEGQMGLEPTPDEFVAGMVEVFREVRRVLRDDGTLWLNIGDSYTGYHGNRNAEVPTSALNGWTNGTNENARTSTANRNGLKQKDLIGIPWMLAFALRADGWYLRQEIIWAKPNPMPESVTDRCTKAHESIFLLSKSPRYYFDAAAIAEPPAPSSLARWAQNVDEQAGSNRVPGKTNGPMKAVGGNGWKGSEFHKGKTAEHQLGRASKNRTNVKPGKIMAAEPTNGESTFGFGETRNKRSVWTVPTQPYSEAHFATYPPALIEPCILAGCPAGGTVLDPFGGAGTTGMVADRLGRNAILVELNPEYAALAERRLSNDGGMFADVRAA